MEALTPEVIQAFSEHILEPVLGAALAIVIAYLLLR